MSERPTAVGVDIFAGGFTLGVKRHFDVLCHLEEGPYGVATMRRNQPEIPVFVGAETWPMADLRELRPAFVYGNPPCAAWSPLGKIIQQGNVEEQWASDPRVNCTRVHFNVLEYLRPRVWAWESVPPAYTRGRPLVRELTRRALDLGYSVTFVLHNAMYCGTPQHRRRFFMVAHDVALDWEADFRDPPTVTEMLARYPASNPNHVPMPTKAQLRFLRFVRQGENLRTARERYVERYGEKRARAVKKTGFSLRRLRADRVAGAMISSRFLHPTEPRYLTVGEMLHFSGFPLDYRLSGNPHAQASEIGRGVMPPVGAWLARIVAAGLRRDRPDRGRVVEANLYQPPGAVRELNPKEL